ncbi:M48 family metallopeptidase [Paractinoplanes durhamensis]|uniref:M48 family metallopeptidase n=1 Tax=Paractinoplanes durhamensis TaxID=113563 RepID=UPI0036383971
MRDGNRATVTAAMFAGFLLVAWLQVMAALLIVLLVLKVLPGAAAVRIALPLVIATAGLLWYATVRALRLRRPSLAGVAVTRKDAPALWAMIDDAATAAGVKAPDAVTVVAGAAVTLVEHVRLTGLLGGRRELFIGMPVLLAWDESWLRAAVAHELAHGSPKLGRFAAMAYRGRGALGRIVPRIPRRSPAGPALRAYARWFHRVDAPFAREQELLADRIAAEFAGGRAAAGVLRDGPALEGLQQLFHAEYLSPGWQSGFVPDDVFGGFLRVLAARADDLAMLRAVEPEAPGSGTRIRRCPSGWPRCPR